MSDPAPEQAGGDPGTEDRFRRSDAWLDRGGPEDHVVVSSRARYARNLPRVPFPMRARQEELQAVVEQVRGAIRESGFFRDGNEFDITGIRPIERNYLKENHLISSEMEKGGENRAIFVSADVRLAVMVNEEDHLRMFALAGGFQPHEALNEVMVLEDGLSRLLPFAFSPKYGYLTACPTNTGTGLRASVMLHLPALSMLKKMPELVKSMPQFGLTVRGFYGENSENMGDFFQLSNEVTLGRSEQEIVDILTKVTEQIVEKEEQARRNLFEQNRAVIEDEVWRSFGILTHARVMTSQEAVQLLSKLRFGIDRGFFPAIPHSQLNRIIIEIQPGHLQYLSGGAASSETRDLMRADLLRTRLAPDASRN
jgi:protein arginine kinase